MADRALAAVVVVLCVVALALAASTLATTSGVERGSGEGSGPGSSNQPQGQPPSNESATEPLGLDGGWVETLIGVFLLLALPSVVFLGRDRLLGAVLAVGFFAGIVALFWYFAGGLGAGPVQAAAENVSAGLDGGGDMGSADQSTAERDRSAPSAFTFGIVGVALVMAVGLVYYASSSVDESVDPDPPDDSQPDETTTVAEVAGRAADRIDDHEGDAANAVYVAWTEMTDALDGPDPATSTPGEFADAAVAAGMGADRVADLTDCFERVRYGDEPVTEHHERRATETLRAIEAHHDDVDANHDRLDAAATGPDGERSDAAATPDGERSDRRGGEES